jgi:adenine phosphoribosyltransferase
MLENIKNEIVDVADFPILGVNFKDISQLLKSKYFKDAIKLMGEKVEIPDYWIGIESRGFIFASALSMHYGGGLVLCRKKGKLPPPKIALEYQLEYGTDTLEIKQGDGTAVIVDDVLATGGTMNAAEQLALNAGYNVTDKLVLINLKFLNSELSIKSLIEYE